MTHLVVLCHGLWGSRRDWDALVSALQDDPEIILHVSTVNEWGLTYQGAICATLFDTKCMGCDARVAPWGRQRSWKPASASGARRLWDHTDAGVDVCGARLAAEVCGLAAQLAGRATHLSLLGHSMGGLIARYAAGLLFEPATGTMAGLTPRCVSRFDRACALPLSEWWHRGRDCCGTPQCSLPPRAMPAAVATLQARTGTPSFFCVHPRLAAGYT
jgi:pimeloyl-ACP methyl ester carboxylesterase